MIPWFSKTETDWQFEPCESIPTWEIWANKWMSSRSRSNMGSFEPYSHFIVWMENTVLQSTKGQRERSGKKGNGRTDLTRNSTGSTWGWLEWWVSASKVIQTSRVSCKKATVQKFLLWLLLLVLVVVVVAVLLPVLLCYKEEDDCQWHIHSTNVKPHDYYCKPSRLGSIFFIFWYHSACLGKNISLSPSSTKPAWCWRVREELDEKPNWNEIAKRDLKRNLPIELKMRGKERVGLRA